MFPTGSLMNFQYSHTGMFVLLRFYYTTFPATCSIFFFTVVENCLKSRRSTHSLQTDIYEFRKLTHDGSVEKVSLAIFADFLSLSKPNCGLTRVLFSCVAGSMTLTSAPCEVDTMSLFQDLKLKRRKVDSRCSSDGKCFYTIFQIPNMRGCKLMTKMMCRNNAHHVLLGFSFSDKKNFPF